METAYVPIPKEVFSDLVKRFGELEEIMETLEIMADKAMMDDIKKSEEDIKAGRVTKLKDINKLGEE